ncbi:MAG TPA: RluA family pseudouridine synthase [Treponemataceae bacterium]|nr:RluA family pseudouridine synthase [Treponemataceae bacterium]
MTLTPYSHELATEYCHQLIDLFDKTGMITSIIENETEKAHYSTKQLFKPYKGHMFGVLVCRPTRQSDLKLSDLDENGYIILKAFSGQFFGKWNVPGYVAPCFDVNEWKNEVLRSDSKIKEASGKQQKEYSKDSLKHIYSLYTFHCIHKKTKTFEDFYSLMNPILSEHSLPPTGTGDCCAPKLLNYAFKHGLQPLSLAEFYYGAENKSKTRKHLEFYSPCQKKCSLVLPEMLGIEIVYYDSSIVVVNKPAGLLSVPGRTNDKKDCVVARVRRLFPHCILQPSVHRLDMETSGLLVMALTKEAHRNISIQFQNRQTKKEYTALLGGSLFHSDGDAARKAVKKYTHQKEKPNLLSGCITLAFRLDIDNRPYQIYDEINGKEGISNWIRIREEKLGKEIVTRIKFMPITGRTHQLRLHSAHKKGLACPIVGDSLYGSRKEHENRMMLHANYLSFFHPDTGKEMIFSKKSPF